MVLGSRKPGCMGLEDDEEAGPYQAGQPAEGATSVRDPCQRGRSRVLRGAWRDRNWGWWQDENLTV